MIEGLVVSTTKMAHTPLCEVIDTIHLFVEKVGFEIVVC